MANYDRRILVPYLRDVCSMEMLCSQLSREVEECRANINALDSDINQKPYSIKNVDWYDFKPDHSGRKGIFMLFGICPLILGLLWWLAFGVRWVFVIAAVFAIIVGLPIKVSMDEDTMRAYKHYDEQVQEYSEKRKFNRYLENQMPKWKQQREHYRKRFDASKSRLASAVALRQELYEINVIPSRYRNIHVSYYLYDFFNTSRETDLEKVIQTMLLDEIIKRLDKIIVQNEKIILNQRMQLALQENTNKMIAENHRDEMKEIVRMERNQELQMDYQRMIAKNQEVTNFFLAVEYLRNN